MTSTPSSTTPGLPSGSTVNASRWPLLVTCLVAGSALGIGFTLPLDPVIRMPDELGAWPLNPSPEYIVRYNRAYSNMWMGNMAINFALLGAAIGSVTALVYARGASAIARMMMAVLSLIGGAAGGAVTGYLLASAHSNQGHINLLGWQMDFMLQSVLLQTLGWGLLGIGLGLAIARASGRPVGSGVAGGVLGGFAAGLTHALVGTIAFPNSDTSLVMPLPTVERFVWAAYCAAALAGGIGYLMKTSKSDAAANPTATDLA